MLNESSTNSPITNDIIRTIKRLHAENQDAGGCELADLLLKEFRPFQIIYGWKQLTGESRPDEDVIDVARQFVGRTLNADDETENENAGTIHVQKINAAAAKQAGGPPRYADIAAINNIGIKLTGLEAEFLVATIDGLYAEPGFSDTDLKEIAERMNKGRLNDISIESAKGILGSLVKKNILFVGDAGFEGIVYLHSEFYHLHRVWAAEMAAEAGEIPEPIAVDQSQIYPTREVAGKIEIRDIDGDWRDAAEYGESLARFPSPAIKCVDKTGRAALVNVTYIPAGCGCQIVGCGTLQFPLQIQFCSKHRQC